MTENLLDQNTDPEEIDPNKNYFEELVGENKKFKTPEELAKGKAVSDAYIKTLERQRDELRNDYLKIKDDYNTRAKLEEVLDKLTAAQQSSTDSSTQNANDMNKSQINPQEIESLVSNKLQEYETNKKRQENFNLVRNTLQDRFGPNWKTAIGPAVATLGISEDYINETARTHPQALLAMFPPKAQEDGFQSPPQNSRRSDSFAPRGAEKRTWSYYQKMKQDNPKQYYDPKTTVQMHKDALALGPVFEDGDFKAR